MKKSLLVLFSLVLAASLLLASFGKAQAFDWTAPVVTPVYGDKEFDFKVTAPANLPGTILSGEIRLPSGFPEGSAQFGGDGAVVKNLLKGSEARVCFSMPPKRTQWEGSVFQWKDERWVRLSTTVSQSGDEASFATACAEIYGDGTYALIMGYTGKPEPKGLPVCSEPVTIAGYAMIGIGPDPKRSYMPDKYLSQILHLVISSKLPIGTPVTYQLINITPAGSLGGVLSRTANVRSVEAWGSEVRYFETTDWDNLSPDRWTYGDAYLWEKPLTIRLIFPTCYADVADPFHLIGSN